MINILLAICAFVLIGCLIGSFLKYSDFNADQLLATPISKVFIIVACFLTIIFIYFLNRIPIFAYSLMRIPLLLLVIIAIIILIASMKIHQNRSYSKIRNYCFASFSFAGISIISAYGIGVFLLIVFGFLVLLLLILYTIREPMKVVGVAVCVFFVAIIGIVSAIPFISSLNMRMQLGYYSHDLLHELDELDEMLDHVFWEIGYDVTSENVFFVQELQKLELLIYDVRSFLYSISFISRVEYELFKQKTYEIREFIFMMQEMLKLDQLLKEARCNLALLTATLGVDSDTSLELHEMLDYLTSHEVNLRSDISRLNISIGTMPEERFELAMEIHELIVATNDLRQKLEEYAELNYNLDAYNHDGEIGICCEYTIICPGGYAEEHALRSNGSDS